VSAPHSPRPDPSILERNLELLLGRAYAPVVPSLAFRARLAAALEQEIAERAPALRLVQPRRSLASRIGVQPVWLRAAAAILLFVLGAFTWKLAAHASPTESRAVRLERIAAGGRTAVCTSENGESETVREVSDAEIARGIDYAGSSLTAWTAPGSTLPIWIGGAGRLAVRASTRVDVAGAPDEHLAVDLERGAIELERYATGGAWSVTTREGIVHLERGALVVAVAPRGADAVGPRSEALGVALLLRTGSAYVDEDGRRVALALGAETALRGGHLAVAADPLAQSGDGFQREQAGNSAPPENPVLPAASKARGTLHGELVPPANGVLPDSYTITLLRDERLPAISTPEVHVIADKSREFTIGSVRPGTYTVFAEVRGFAVWQRRGVVVATDAPSVSGGSGITATAATDLSIDLKPGQRLSGRVVDAESGRPIEGAVVLSQRDAPAQILPLAMERAPEGWLATATSGPDGTFEIESLSRGKHTLRATHAGFGAAWSESIDVEAETSRADVELRLARGGTVFGHVAHKDGTAWSGAIIIASRLDYKFEERCMSYGTSIADGEGAFEIADLPAGPYVVINVLEPKEEHVASPHVSQVNVVAGARVEVDLAGVRKGTRLSGRIVAAPGEPVAGLDVILEPHEPRPHARKWQSERARDDGSFVFLDLPPGPYDVYISEAMGQRFVLEDVVEVPSVPEFPYSLRIGPGLIQGHVTDGAEKRGLVQAVVVLEIEKEGEYVFAGRAVSDAEGRYDFRRLPIGTYRVTAFATTGRFGPEVREGLRVDATTNEIDLALASGAALEVHVTDPEGRPIPSAAVAISDENGRRMQFAPEDLTDAHGKLAINGIKPGRWTVTVSHAGYRTTSAVVDLQAGLLGTVEIRLQTAR
jgi:protocatechuate 3,4-dioxygenase beta subunit